MKVLERLFFRRPRILNALHKFHLVSATSQTNSVELAALARYAAGAKTALEIGSYQGVSAGRIATALPPDGRLFCIDPWPEENGRKNPCLEISRRHLNRLAVQDRIRIIRKASSEARGDIPDQIDFAFIDGDHSWTGIETDWNLVGPRVIQGGIICLHDTVVPPSEPWRQFDSVRFFQERIAPDDGYETMETVHSMTVVRKL